MIFLLTMLSIVPIVPDAQNTRKISYLSRVDGVHPIVMDRPYRPSRQGPSSLSGQGRDDRLEGIDPEKNNSRTMG